VNSVFNYKQVQRSEVVTRDNYAANMVSMSHSPLKAIIVDDEPLACRILRRYLQDDTDIEVIQQCTNGLDALEAIQKFRPDLVFLDVQIPGMSGFEVLAALAPEDLPFVIFVTAYDEYALQAFEFHALDYLLKPLDQERFKKAVKHAKEQIRQHQENRLLHHVTALLSQFRPPASKIRQPDQPYASRLEIRSTGHVNFVDVEEIDWIEAADNYVVLHTSAGSHLMRESMSRLESTLDPNFFVRIHRSRIVNLSRIRELKSRGFGDRIVVLQDGTELRVSRIHKEKLETMLKTFSNRQPQKSPLP
jgi:two-component system, LytTR family, response regulator